MNQTIPHYPPVPADDPTRNLTIARIDEEMEATFRGRKTIVKAGDTVNIPANTPHRFHNVSLQAVRLLCIASPAGLDDLFRETGTPVAARTTPPPELDETQQAARIKKATAAAPKFRTELLKEAWKDGSPEIGSHREREE